MKPSVIVSAPTPRANSAAKNERAFAVRRAARQNPLSITKSAPQFELENGIQATQARRAAEYKQSFSARSVSRLSRNYFRSRKKFLAQLKTKNKLPNGL